jgi:CRP/FNR family cyclic AMP-dependent transcriptional regulator
MSEVSAALASEEATHEEGSPDGPASQGERLRARFGRRFAPGDVIFREGEEGSCAFLLEEGRVRLIKRVRGVERSLMVLKPGDLFGESALLNGAPRSSTAIALSAGPRAVARSSDPAELARAKPGRRLSARQAARSSPARRRGPDRDHDALGHPVQGRQRAAQARAESYGVDAQRGPVVLDLPMELSTRVGLDVDTVKRVVQELREGQYIRVSEERLEIPDIDALRRLFALLGVKDEIRGAPEDPG